MTGGTWGANRGWNEVLVDEEGKPAGFTEGPELADKLVAARPELVGHRTEMVYGPFVVDLFKAV